MTERSYDWYAHSKSSLFEDYACFDGGYRLVQCKLFDGARTRLGKALGLRFCYEILQGMDILEIVAFIVSIVVGFKSTPYLNGYRRNSHVLNFHIEILSLVRHEFFLLVFRVFLRKKAYFAKSIVTFSCFLAVQCVRNLIIVHFNT